MRKRILILIYPLIGALLASFASTLWVLYHNSQASAGIYVEIPPELREGREISYNIPFLYFTRYYPMKKDSVSYTLEENSLFRKENISGLISRSEHGLRTSAEYALPSNYKFLPTRVVSPPLYLKTLKIYGPEKKARSFLASITSRLTDQLFSLLKIKSYYSRVHIQNLLYLRTRIERKIQELKGKIIFLEEVGRKYGNKEGPNLATSVEPYFLAYLSPNLQARASSIIIHELETDLAVLNKEVDYFSKYSKFYNEIQSMSSCEEAEKRANALFPPQALSRVMGELERDCLPLRIFSVNLPLASNRASFRVVFYTFVISFIFFLALTLAWNALKDEV